MNDNQERERLLTSEVGEKMTDSKEKYNRVARLGKISKLIKKLVQNNSMPYANLDKGSV